MNPLFHELLLNSAQSGPHQHALTHAHRRETTTYEQTAASVLKVARGLQELGINKGDRIAIYLPKLAETVVTIFAATMAGGVFVPINPHLKPAQVQHILLDSGAKVIVTSESRLRDLIPVLNNSPDIKIVVSLSEVEEKDSHLLPKIKIAIWNEMLSGANTPLPTHVKPESLAAILYTSGSTGLPKGVMLSHSNLVLGAQSVSTYLNNHQDDKILAILPFSFDYGLSQLTTAFNVGASVILLDYLLPREVLNILVEHQITGLAAVPPFWIQLALLPWPEEIGQTLRYITNSGGAMPESVLRKLQANLPKTEIFLMYGLTESFRSTYLPPAELAKRPHSIGKAIPNVDVHVINKHGKPCAPNEQGELVHCGPLVSMGYWNAPEKTAARFRPLSLDDQTTDQLAVWSGDSVVMDEAGYLYFIGREDEMIKTSGYRVSPTEIEEIALSTNLVGEAVAFGTTDEMLGQAIILYVSARQSSSLSKRSLQLEFKRRAPAYMMPAEIIIVDWIPHTENGKVDRVALRQTYSQGIAPDLLQNPK